VPHPQRGWGTGQPDLTEFRSSHSHKSARGARHRPQRVLAVRACRRWNSCSRQLTASAVALLAASNCDLLGGSQVMLMGYFSAMDGPVQGWLAWRSPQAPSVVVTDSSAPRQLCAGLRACGGIRTLARPPSAAFCPHRPLSQLVNSKRPTHTIWREEHPHGEQPFWCDPGRSSSTWSCSGPVSADWPTGGEVACVGRGRAAQFCTRGGCPTGTAGLRSSHVSSPRAWCGGAR